MNLEAVSVKTLLLIPKIGHCIKSALTLDRWHSGPLLPLTRFISHHNILSLKDIMLLCRCIMGSIITTSESYKIKTRYLNIQSNQSHTSHRSLNDIPQDQQLAYRKSVFIQLHSQPARLCHFTTQVITEKNKTQPLQSRSLSRSLGHGHLLSQSIDTVDIVQQ